MHLSKALTTKIAAIVLALSAMATPTLAASARINSFFIIVSFCC